MKPQTKKKTGEAKSWSGKRRRITQEETAAVREKVQMTADRARENRIKGRPHIWSDLKQ